MARPLNPTDWLVIIALVITAIILIYLLRPLIIAVAIIATAYLIYKWYRGGRPIAPT
jgi:hypothetical protein